MQPLPSNIEELDHNTQWMVNANRLSQGRMECLDELGPNQREEVSHFTQGRSQLSQSMMSDRFFNE
jgi:hypothetical protein